jgi:uncharacterized protein
VPLDLGSSCEKISQRSNWIYANRFLKSLKNKILTKSALMPGKFDVRGIHQVKTLLQFDDRYTAPLHGFNDAADYYTKCSAINYLAGIHIPALIINTRNDPFLSTSCFPSETLKDHPFVRLEILLRGGHVGFTQFNKNGLYWSEQRALEFITNQ